MAIPAVEINCAGLFCVPFLFFDDLLNSKEENGFRIMIGEFKRFFNGEVKTEFANRP